MSSFLTGHNHRLQIALNAITNGESFGGTPGAYSTIRTIKEGFSVEPQRAKEKSPELNMGIRWLHAGGVYFAWTIKVALELCVNDNPVCRGLCDQYPDINAARLTFRADIEDTSEWRHVVIHELIHMAHSRIDHAVERAILPELPQAVQQLAREMYHQYVESFVDYLDSTLYKATVALDYPEEQDEESVQQSGMTARQEQMIATMVNEGRAK